jgi:hypothetical protein
MAEIDDEVVARALRWCAEAGRHASADQVRAALAPLSWDELLAARALLADPPPARPLGPHALADLARGALPDVAAEREREGRYGPGTDAPLPAPPEDAPRPARQRAAARRGAAGPIVRRARDRAPEAPAPAPRRPALDALFEEEGRAVLERLVREHGARRAVLAAALTKGWARGDGSAPDEGDLARLLDAHRLTRGFERRERDEARYALRAAGGLTAPAAAALGVPPGALPALLRRLGVEGEAEALREVRRAELRRRGTLSERLRLLSGDEARLADLGLLADFEDDLRARLPEHARALRAAGAGTLAPALARSLGVTPAEIAAIAARLGIDLAKLGSTPTSSPSASRSPSSSRSTSASPPRTSAPATSSSSQPMRPRVPRARPPRRPAAGSAGRGGARPPPRRPARRKPRR